MGVEVAGVVLMVKTRAKRNDIAEASLWQQVFSDRDPQPGRPRLRWPGDPNDRDVSSMIAGMPRATSQP
jgi:hypothetical protein